MTTNVQFVNPEEEKLIEQVIELVTETEPLKKIDMVYNTTCWHCNPNRYITPHPEPPYQPSALGFYDLRPTCTHPLPKKERQIIKSKYLLKSFDLTEKNKIKKSTHVPTPQDIMYSRQRSFMKLFGIDVLNKDELVMFTKIIKAFMVELAYDPTDKEDVILFYSQESGQDIYDVYTARCSPLVKKYAQVFEVNLENYDNVLDFMHQIRTYILEEKDNTDLMKFLKENNPEHVYVDVKIVKALKQLKLNMVSE
jgi:hypothetical protein